MITQKSSDQYENELRRSSSSGLVIRQKEPPNLEMPFDQLDSFLTPTEGRVSRG